MLHLSYHYHTTPITTHFPCPPQIHTIAYTILLPHIHRLTQHTYHSNTRTTILLTTHHHIDQKQVDTTIGNSQHPNPNSTHLAILLLPHNHHQLLIPITTTTTQTMTRTHMPNLSARVSSWNFLGLMVKIQRAG
uniref:Uncharacterized protein n=1 Tax=Arundo donax TaxID=35708 RepID=A0A0A9BTJ6_ARUDO